ncbi:MAG: ArnT family glycosyltransferase [Phycisphaerae bacterium]
MIVTPSESRRMHRIALSVILALFAGMSIVGLTWGLPGREIDKYMFGSEGIWPGDEIYRLADAQARFSSDRGADVDADPTVRLNSGPTRLSADPKDIAKIYLRYRLYTYQPDEMITMMALAGMNPRGFDLDPRLYQYGGLFIYPVGILLKLSDVVGLIDVRRDVAYYLDNPAEFGKFYIVARVYSAAWGLVGVCIVFAIGRRLSGTVGGLLAALLFSLMPVVVCMAHEGKPHLPGAVLMLSAGLFAMRHLHHRAAGRPPLRQASRVGPREASYPSDISSPTAREEDGACTTAPPNGSSRRQGALTQIDGSERHANRDWWLMCICCGAALGMVLSSWPIFVLIPTVALLGRRPWGAQAHQTGARPLGPNAKPPARDKMAVSTSAIRTFAGVALAIAVYLIANPYILINALSSRGVLASNFSNSLSMYEVSRVGEGFLRVVELAGEGATWPVVILGLVGLTIGVARRNTDAWPVVITTAAFVMQFSLIGAGKPAEYGRFGVFADTALAIGASYALASSGKRRLGTARTILGLLTAISTVLYGGAYLWNFRTDTTGNNSRIRAAQRIARLAEAAARNGKRLVVALKADPAPYGCPPMDFTQVHVVLVRSLDELGDTASNRPYVLVQAIDRSEPRTGSGSRGMPDRALPCWVFPCDTPISWANKPFKVERVGLQGDTVMGQSG